VPEGRPGCSREGRGGPILWRACPSPRRTTTIFPPPISVAGLAALPRILVVVVRMSLRCEFKCEVARWAFCLQGVAVIYGAGSGLGRWPGGPALGGAGGPASFGDLDVDEQGLAETAALLGSPQRET